MTTEEMKALARRAIQAWNDGKPEIIDEVYAPNFVNGTRVFTLTGTDNAGGSGILRTEYRIDAGGWTTGKSTVALFDPKTGEAEIVFL